MSTKLPDLEVRSDFKPPSTPRRMVVLLLTGLAAWLATAAARAAFHLWNVSEVYSSADGKVQFIELSTASGSQQFVQNQTITSVNSTGSHTFTFPANLPSDSLNKSCIIGTSNMTSFPGGVRPDFFIPTNFILPAVNGANAAVTFSGSGSSVSVTNLPLDGVLSLTRSGASIILATNLPKNFSGQSNTIVPVKFLSANIAGANLVMSFRTATGPNGSAGTNYAIEAISQVNSNNWSVVSNVTGNGTVKNIALPIAAQSNRLFRLRVP